MTDCLIDRLIDYMSNHFLGDRVQHLKMTSSEAFKLSAFYARRFDIIHLRDESAPSSFLHTLVVCFEQLVSRGVLVVGEWYEANQTINIRSVIEMFIIIG